MYAAHLTHVTHSLNTRSVSEAQGVKRLLLRHKATQDRAQLQNQPFSGHQENAFSRITHLFEN